MVLVTHDTELLPAADRVIDFDELKERSARMEGEVQKLVLGLSTWKPGLDPKIKAIKPVISYEVEPNPEVLQRLGIPPELFKGVVFVDDADEAGLAAAPAGAQQFSTDTLFERYRMKLETSSNRAALPELLKLLVENDVQVLAVFGRRVSLGCRCASWALLPSTKQAAPCGAGSSGCRTSSRPCRGCSWSRMVLTPSAAQRFFVLGWIPFSTVTAASLGTITVVLGLSQQSLRYWLSLPLSVRQVVAVKPVMGVTMGLLVAAATLVFAAAGILRSTA